MVCCERRHQGKATAARLALSGSCPASRSWRASPWWWSAWVWPDSPGARNRPRNRPFPSRPGPPRSPTPCGSGPPASSSRSSGSGPARAAGLAQTVTLLTTQARALLPRARPDPMLRRPTGRPRRPADPGGTALDRLASPPAPLPAPPAGAGRRPARERLPSALPTRPTADGGMARLLAAVGTAQLLQAVLARGRHRRARCRPAGRTRPCPPLSAACPGSGGLARLSAPVAPASRAPATPSRGGPAGRHAGGPRLSGRSRRPCGAEAGASTRYQAALTRLGGERRAAPRAGQLARHEALLSGAEALSLRHCVSPSRRGRPATPWARRSWPRRPPPWPGWKPAPCRSTATSWR